MVFAVALSVVTLRTGGLEAALALHLVHNAVCWVVSAAYGATGSIADYTEVGAGMFVVSALGTAVYVTAVLVLARRRAVETMCVASLESDPERHRSEIRRHVVGPGGPCHRWKDRRP